MARDGNITMLEIADAHPGDFLRYHKGVQVLRSLSLCTRRDISVPVNVYWWFGPTGTGKSRLAWERYPDCYTKMMNKWWDGYEGQKVVLFDDYRPNMCTFAELLRMLDRYPMMVEFKGGSCHLSATTFVITTTSRPEVIWSGRTAEALNQLLRRITEIMEFHLDGSRTCLKDLQTEYVMLPPPSVVDTFVLPRPRVFV